MSDWPIQFLGRPRASEIPAVYVVEVWEDHTRDDPSKLKRQIPVNDFTTQAAAFSEQFGDDLTVDRNNLSQTGAVDTSGARAAQVITGPGAFAEFTMLPQAGTCNMAVQFHSATDETWDDLPHITAAGLWNMLFYHGAGNGIPSGGWGVNIYDRDGSFLLPALTDLGKDTFKIRVAFVGTEVRFYKDWVNSASRPIAIGNFSSAGEFPLKMCVFLSSQGDVFAEHFVLSGMSSTIYSAAQQIEDFGVEQPTLFLRIYQKARYEDVGNPIDVWG